MDRPLPSYEQLHAFILLARYASAQNAAAQSDYGADELMQHIDALERLLMQQLFVQYDDQYTLSPAGLSLIEHAQLILSLHEQCFAMLDLANNEASELKLSYQSWIPCAWLTLLSRQLTQQQPCLQLHFTHSPLGHLHFSYSPHSPSSAMWQRLKWGHVELIKVAHPRLKQPQCFDQHLGLFSLAEPTRYATPFKGESLLIDALLNGLGWAIVPRLSVSAYLSEGSLKQWACTPYELDSYLYISPDCPPPLRQWLKLNAQRPRV